MCQWGDSICVYVPIPAELSHTGEFRLDVKPIDRCIASLVQALNAAGIWTASSCCGHGKEPGTILLHDGRKLVVCTTIQ